MTLSIPVAITWGMATQKVSAQKTISEQDVVTLISKMEYYTNQGNVEQLLKYIDKDVSIAIASEIGVEPALVRIANLKTFFSKGFENIDSFELDLDINEIMIEEQVATVTGTTIDRSVKGNIETISNLLWRNVIEEQDGELKIIQWESRITGYSIREIEP